MDVKKAIETRRSIRKYLPKPVSEELIYELIDAARLAPSGNNAQPGKYLIVNDDKTKNVLKKNEVFTQSFVYTAPTIIFCCANPNAYKKNITGIDNSNDMRAIRDLTIASQNIVLRATELGLGTCYVGWVDENKSKELLSIPKDYILPYVITVGYANETPNARPRKTIDEILIKNN